MPKHQQNPSEQLFAKTLADIAAKGKAAKCANCEQPIGWYQLAQTTVKFGDDLEFCCEACAEEWMDKQDNTDEVLRAAGYDPDEVAAWGREIVHKAMKRRVYREVLLALDHNDEAVAREWMSHLSSDELQTLAGSAAMLERLCREVFNDLSEADSMHAPDIGLRRDADGELYEVDQPPEAD